MQPRQYVRVKKSLASDSRGNVIEYYSDNSQTLFTRITDKKIISEADMKNYFDLIRIIREKFKTGVSGRSKIFNNYDFVIVESLPANHKLTKINVITQKPVQLLQFDEKGNQRVILEEKPLIELLNTLNLSHFLTDKDFNLETSNYDVLLFKGERDWARLKRNEIAIFSKEETLSKEEEPPLKIKRHYYTVHGDNKPHLLPELDDELNWLLQKHSEGGKLYSKGCDLFLMSSNVSSFKISTPSHLYLYKDDKGFFYSSIHDLRKHQYLDKERGQLLINEEFDQPAENPVKCMKPEIAHEVCRETSNRGHTVSWKGDQPLILHVLNEAEKNGHLYKRKSVLNMLSGDEQKLYELHKAIVAQGGKPLFNSDKVSLVFHCSAIEQREWTIMLKTYLPEFNNFKKTLLIVTEPNPALYQVNEVVNAGNRETLCITLLKDDACRKAFADAKLTHLLEIKQSYSSIMSMLNLERLSRLDKIVLDNNGQSILAPADHPVVNILKTFDSVEMVREQSDPFYLKNIAFTFPLSKAGEILQSFTLMSKPDDKELQELRAGTDRMAVLC